MHEWYRGENRQIKMKLIIRRGKKQYYIVPKIMR